MRHKVTFRPAARADLKRIYNYIADNAGSARAGSYLERIVGCCETLRNFPERGTRRDDLQPGLRTMGFERRATIAFRVLQAEVEIVRVLYGGRDLDAHLRDRG